MSWLSSHLGWVLSASGFALLFAVCPMLTRALYRYVLRKLEESEQALEAPRQALMLYHRIYGDDGVMPLPGEKAPMSEVIKTCRLLWGILPTPLFVVRLAKQWEDHRKKGRL